MTFSSNVKCTRYWKHIVALFMDFHLSHTSNYLAQAIQQHLKTSSNNCSNEIWSYFCVVVLEVIRYWLLLLLQSIKFIFIAQNDSDINYKYNKGVTMREKIMGGAHQQWSTVIEGSYECLGACPQETFEIKAFREWLISIFRTIWSSIMISFIYLTNCVLCRCTL